MVPSTPVPLPWLTAVATAAALAALTVHAAPPAAASRPDPLDPLASVPALQYQSTLRPDRRAAADKPLTWREANDAVTRIGGWRAYAREAQQPDPAPPAKPAAAVTSTTTTAPAAAQTAPPRAPHGHSGHHKP
jgi:hypothetical protein